MDKMTKKPQKDNRRSGASIPGEWLYFSPKEVTVRQIAALLPNDLYELEIWEEAGVLEVEIGDACSVDIEHTQIHPRDEITHAFARENHCKEVFLVTFVPEHYEKAKEVMLQILKGNGGLFCGDTEDFSPILKKED